MAVENTKKTAGARSRTLSVPSTPRKINRSLTSTPDSADHSIFEHLPPRPSSVLRAPTPSQGLKIRAQITLDAKIRKKPSGILTSGNRSRSNSPLPASPPKAFARPIFGRADDPEAGLVDWKNVGEEECDVSIEVDEEDIFNPGGEDKVLVSVRVKPTSEDGVSAWITNARQATVKLEPSYGRAGVTAPEFCFDNVLGGSENKPVYSATAKSHVRAAMEGYNAVIFAYGQTASGKTFTLSGDENEPGIIPRSMRDVFRYIRKTPSREFLLRASYLEIYNEQIHDLLSPAATGSLTLQDSGVVVGLREEVVTSVKGLREVLERGEANRRTASTDWNSRSSRSHSVFRLTIESRDVAPAGESTASPGATPSTPGGSRLQARGGRSVRSSTLSLIDLAGSERATTDKDRTREGKYINTSLLTLGTVISTLAENAAKKKQDFVPYRNSKLTKLLQPSLSGNARVSVICTLNPTPLSIAESNSTLQFASRVKKVALHATKKETVDTDALIERYRKEIEELKARLGDKEREVQAPTVKRRLSAREKKDESKAMSDLSTRINQLTRLILTSQSVADGKGDESRPSSPCKLDFELTPFQLQEQLLIAKRTMESQLTQILSLEAALQARPLIPYDAPEDEKDKLIADLQKTVREHEIVIGGYEENLGAPLRAVKEDVEREWKPQVESLESQLEDKTEYIEELERGLEKMKQMHLKSEQQKMALIGFVKEIDGHFALTQPTSASGVEDSTLSSLNNSTSFRPTLSPLSENIQTPSLDSSFNRSPTKKNFRDSLDSSPIKMPIKPIQSLMELTEDEFGIGADADASFGEGLSIPALFDTRPKISSPLATRVSKFGDKENMPV